jgi:precorrin-3B synthase
VTTRTHEDRCPGVLRPWQAQDGAIVRLRVPGGRISPDALMQAVDAAQRYGDGTVLLTRRANLQLRGIPTRSGAVPDGLVALVEAAGLLPSRSHELVRNIVSSPLTGLLGGRLDLRPVVHQLDAALLAEPALGGLGGRFLFVLDDGRGDVVGRDLDLGVVAVDAGRVQLRAGATHWGPVVEVAEAAGYLARLAGRFQELRGDGARAWWHVDEVPGGGAAVLGGTWEQDPATAVQSPPVPVGRHDTLDGRSLDVVPVPEGLLRADLAEQLVATGVDQLVITPWRSMVVPGRVAA